jgi:hypothetical protein
MSGVMSRKRTSLRARPPCGSVRDVFRQWLPVQGMVGEGGGKAMELGKVLAPLTEFREKLLFVRGLVS